jgi:Ion channel
MDRTAIRRWQDRLRDPSLTVLLTLELGAIFVAAPLAAQGWRWARSVAETLVLAVVLIVVAISHRRGAILAILLGLSATLAGLWLQRSPVAESLLSRGGGIVTYSALSWVVANAVYAPGRITFRRLQGAVVLYLNLATIFASAYHLLWELDPGAFANIGAPRRSPSEIALMLYFSFTTLTSTGFGDIVPVSPFARSLANLEAVVGQLYLATTIARLVTLELQDRRGERK